MLSKAISFRTILLTGTVSREKTFPLDGNVAFKYHVHLISGCQYWMRLLGAAEFAENVAVRGITVVNGNVIVIAFLMGFHLENFEDLEKK